MPISLQGISSTVRSLVESSGNLILILGSLSTSSSCPQDLNYIKTECAGIKSALFSLFGAITLNQDVLLPLLASDGQLSRCLDWTLTSVVITFAQLEAETSHLFKEQDTSAQLPWNDNLLKSILLHTQAQHNALNVIHPAVALHSSSMVLEALSHQENLFENLRRTLPSVARVQISIFSNPRRQRASLNEEVVTSLVYQRVLHQLTALDGYRWEEPRMNSIDSLTNGDSSNGTRLNHNRPHVAMSIEPHTKSVGEGSFYAQGDLQYQEGIERSIPTLHSVTHSPEQEIPSIPYAHILPPSNIEDRSETQSAQASFSSFKPSQQSQFSIHSVTPEHDSYFFRSDLATVNDACEDQSPGHSAIGHDLGDEHLPEVVPDYWTQKIPAAASPGPFAPEVAPSRSPKFHAPPFTMKAWGKHTFNLRKPSSSPIPSPLPGSGMRDRVSSISNGSGEGVWMHWFGDHVETFCEPQSFAPMQELYLTIPLVGDTAVQKNAAVERWLKQKSPSPPKFKKDELIVEGVADDGETNIPMKVTFTSVGKQKNIDKIQSIFIGEAVFAVCLFNIADGKTLHNVINEWVPLLRRSSPSLGIIICGFGPGFGAIRPGTDGESVEELERISSGDSTRSDQGSRSGYISFVSRARGFTAAKSVGASAYFECSELSCGDLDRFFSALIGRSAAARMQRMKMDPGRRSVGSFTSPRGSTVSANFRST